MKLLRKLRALFRKGKLDREMSEEMRHHIELQIEENIAAGMNPDEAHYAAQRSFGGVEQIKEIARDARSWVWLEHFRQDSRVGLRALVKHPAFSLTAIVVLALGIGANTAVFTIIDTALFRSLPVSEPNQLVILSKPDDPSPRSNIFFSFPAYEHLRGQTHSLTGLIAFADAQRTLLTGNGSAAEGTLLQTEAVSGNFFTLLGVVPAQGRLLTIADDQPGSASPVAVLGYHCWQTRFGSDTNIIGRSLLLDGVTLTIVGVAAPSFQGPTTGKVIDAWIPLQVLSQFDGNHAHYTDEQNQWLQLVGRLDAGSSAVQAGAELELLYQQKLASLGRAPSGKPAVQGHLTVRPGAAGYNHLLSQYHRLLTLVMVVVGVVLLIACINVAGLLFARMAARQSELALRSALGATRGRLIRQILTETLLLGTAGGLLGLILAHACLSLIAANLLPDLTFSLALNSRALLFAGSASLLMGLFVGLVPALCYGQTNLSGGLKKQSAQLLHGGRSSLGNIIAVTQITLSVSLLIAAGLLVRTLQNLNHVDMGFPRQNLILFRVDLDKNYDAPADAAKRLTAFRDIVPEIEALPQVASLSVAEWVLLGTTGGVKAQIDGYIPGPDENMLVHLTNTGPEFFATMGIPILQGRALTAEEAFQRDPSALPARGCPAVIGEAMARRFFGGNGAIGRQLRLALGKTPALIEIVGVAKDLKIASLRETSPFVVYVPYFMFSSRRPRLSFQVRVTGDASALVASIRAIVSRAEPSARIVYLETMEEIAAHSLVQERTVAKAAGFFSIIALCMSSLGLYGLLAYSVAQRTREIGVRMALGASRYDVLALIIGQGTKLAALGICLGSVAALALCQSISGLLFGVTVFHLPTLAGVVLLMFSMASLAAWLPARRATKVDPMVALRCE